MAWHPDAGVFPTLMLTKMLVPTDFSLCGQLAAQHAFDLARAIGGSVTLLHVLETGDLQTAHLRLVQLSRLGRRPPVCLVFPAVGSAVGNIAQVILRVAEEIQAELIVMGATGHSDHPALNSTELNSSELNPSELGQVVRQVVQGARVPVQVVPGALKIPQQGKRWRTLADR
jgi:nucleotide-binding universal stress UspA family protein